MIKQLFVDSGFVDSDGGRSESAIYPTLKKRWVQRDGMRCRMVGDCVVRAVAVAFDISYDEAFRILDAGPDGGVWDFHDKIGNMVINGWQLRPVKEMTASGRYIRTERRGGHVVAYIDGVRHDTTTAQSPISKIWALVRQSKSGSTTDDVVTKHSDVETFGNDAPPVVTKLPASATFGNDTIGFVRVRKRRLKGGHRDWRACRAQKGMLATTSSSFDLVKAVRVDGKPRHLFVLGLGSQKDHEREGALAWFWVRAIRRMTQHGLTATQRRQLGGEMVRKGARLPTLAQCREWRGGWVVSDAWVAAEPEVEAIIKGRA